MYVDLVLCKFEGTPKKYLFKAPFASYISKGDEVVVETKKGEQRATVVAVCSTEEGGEAFDCLVQVTGATLPLKKVVAKMFYQKIDYKEGEDAGTD